MLPRAGTDRYTPDSEGKDVAKSKAAPKSVDELVLHALKLAATNPKAKWSSAGAKTLFNTKEANTEAAIAECTKPDAPLLKQEGAGGVLTAAGFERVAGTLPAEELGAITKAMAAGMPTTKRVTFLQDAIRRTPDAAAELAPLLEEAVTAKAVELRAEADAKAKQAAAAAANRVALERALDLMRQDHENELTAARKWWEALGQKVTDLPAHPPRPEPAPEPRPKQPARTDNTEPRTAEDKGFRRSTADRLAAAWRDAWEAGKDEGRDYLETAMWNIRGLRMLGETGAKVAFDALVHESDGPAFTGDPVEIVRPGWVLAEEKGDYTALKAAVVKV